MAIDRSGDEYNGKERHPEYNRAPTAAEVGGSGRYLTQGPSSSAAADSNDLASLPNAFSDTTKKSSAKVHDGEAHGPIEKVREVPAAPALSLDTRPVIIDDADGASKSPRLPTSPVSRGSPVSSSSRVSKLKSPTSSWARDPAYSLRRSLLARNLSGKAEPHESVIELKPVESSNKRHERTRNIADKDGSGKTRAANVTISPLAERSNDTDQHLQSAQKLQDLASLPHYEKWLQNKSSHTIRVPARLKGLKDSVHKKILGIRESSPSKNGRHIELDVYRRDPLIDERTHHPHISNHIRSSRYTLWNFLPRQLFAQFSKLANFYFLCVSILQMIPGLSTTGTYTTIVPLLFFVTISMAKEGYDDIRRYRLDKAENTKTTSVLHIDKSTAVAVDGSGDTRPAAIEGPEQWAEKKWQNLRVGDIVKLARNEAVPADLVLLQARGTEETAYFDTMALDGETNLKNKQASPFLADSCQKVNEIANCNAHLVVEDPNLDLYNFEGKITIGEETLPLTNNEIVYRGSVVRNTSEVLGLVIYTGEECKIRMNSTKNPRIKAPALQTVVNKVVVILVIFVVALAIFNTVAYQIWRETTEEKAWYLTNAGVAFFPILTSFIILFNTMIPLSLYVSLEIVKVFQTLLMNDIDMYDEASNTPMEARTSTINEELGQVNYIFSDKTGTLTNNSMRFRKMSVAGTAWLHDSDIREENLTESASRQSLQSSISKGKKPSRTSASSSNATSNSVGASFPPTSCAFPPVRHSSITSHWKPSARPFGSHPELDTRMLLQHIQRKPHTIFAQRVSFLLLSLALCHTCFPEKNKNGVIEYQAASPDEQALVRAAQELGYIVINRLKGRIVIKSFPHGSEGKPMLEEYEVLDVIEFSSNRKRMSVVVRMPDQRICIFCKGADSTIMQLLRLSGLAMAKANEIQQRVSERQNLEAQEVIRRTSGALIRKSSMARTSLGIDRLSMGGIERPSINTARLQPIRDEVDHWLRDRETDTDMSSPDQCSIYYSPRPSAQLSSRNPYTSPDGRASLQKEEHCALVEDSLLVDDAAVFERCFQHVNDFATEGLRTLLYGYRFVEEEEYRTWKKINLDASTSLVDRQDKMDKAGAMIERDLEMAGATAIEDKLQDGVPEAVDKLRRAGIKLFMLTGDKRQTAINIGHSCRLIKDHSSVTILDHEIGDIWQSIAAATVDISSGLVAHSVVVVDGQTLSHITANEPLRKLFFCLAILVDTVICCRASPSQKASLVHSVRSKVKNAITLAIGDGANDIAMIQEAHVGIGITGKEGLQAARTSDYSIAQFRFLTKLLLVHGRWNYIRTCKYTLGTFWKEMLFYLTQALYQRYAGYTGTSLYESWSLSMFNTLFTSLPVIFMGIFEKDLSASTLLAVPELYQSLGPRNAGFNIPLYLAWVALASSQAVIVFFIMLGIFGQALFTTDNGLYAMGAMTFTACIIVINTKVQFWELQNKTYTCAIAMFLSIGGWFLWNLILSAVYVNNVIYDVRDGFLQRFGRNALWWLTLILIVTACWSLEIGIKTIKRCWFPDDVDVFSELEKDDAIRARFEQAAGMPSGYKKAKMRPGDILHHVRTASEDQERDLEVQAMLDRPRNSRRASGTDEHNGGIPTIRRRRHSSDFEDASHNYKVSVTWGPQHVDNADDEDSNGKQKPKGKSTDVQEMLRRGFGSVRRSLDIV